MKTKKYRLPRKLKKKCSKDIFLSYKLPSVRKKVKAMLECSNRRALMNMLGYREFITNL